MCVLLRVGPLFAAFGIMNDDDDDDNHSEMILTQKTKQRTVFRGEQMSIKDMASNPIPNTLTRPPLTPGGKAAVGT